MKQIVINGDNIELLKNYPDNYFDAVVTDPPYGLGKEPNAEELMKDWIEKGYHEISGTGFMGKKWDAFIPQPVFWKEVFRVLKHGGHVLSFFGTRTYDWGVMSMRFAGFEVRDCIQWLYGSGFPKSHNISKAIDKKPNLEKVKDWKRWLELQINNSIKSQKDINLECGFNAIGYARYNSNDYWATNRPTLEKWEKMKNAIGIKTTEWDFICDSNAEKRGYVDSTSGLGGGSGNTVGRFTGKELSNNSIASAAKQWDGWGTALKPANEPIVLARKPLEKGLSIAENILKWGVGGINIDASRIGLPKDDPQVKLREGKTIHAKGINEVYSNGVGKIEGDYFNAQGRFPANIIFTHHEDCNCKGTKKVKGSKDGVRKASSEFGQNSGWNDHENKDTIRKGTADENGQEEVEDWDCHEDCPIRILDEQSGVKATTRNMSYSRGGGDFIDGIPNQKEKSWFKSEVGGASRFFYCAKASKSERNKGLDGFEEKEKPDNYIMPKLTCSECGSKRVDSSNSLVCGCNGKTHYEEQNSLESKNNLAGGNKNFHPTVKPIKLMQYLVKMITPRNGIVLDPFCGSGTTGVACKIEGFEFVGLEQDIEYTKIAQARIENYTENIENDVKVNTENIDNESKQAKLF